MFWFALILLARFFCYLIPLQAVRLREYVVGQGEATDRVAAAVVRSRSGLRDPRRPVASILLAGPPGVWAMNGCRHGHQ
jgi:hypothetical protein